MKTIITIIQRASLLLLLVVPFLFEACNDEFLERNDLYGYLLEDTLLVTDQTVHESVSFQIPGANNAKYMIQLIPKWLQIEEMEGHFTNDQAELTLSVKPLPEFDQVGLYEGNISIYVENKGVFYGTVIYGRTGTPRITLSAASLDFGTALSTQIDISNPNPGSILIWQITDLPDWLSADYTVGFVYGNNTMTVTFTRTITELEPGDYNFQITILNNSTNPAYQLPGSMKVIDFMNPDYLKLVEGDITDAEYNKETALMAVVCKSPNLLHLYNTATNTVNTVTLPAVPACVSMGEDGSKLVIGNTNATITVVDINSPESHQTMEIDCIPFDIVLGSNNWCYITPTEDQWVYFRSMDLTTGEIFTSQSSSSIYEKTLIKKIRNKDNLLATRTTLSPTGILLIDTSPGIAKNNINYWHTTIDPFWLSEDGERFFCATGKIYRTPTYSDENIHSIEISAIGDLGQNWDYKINWIDHCEASNKLYVLRENTSYYQNTEDTFIESYDAYHYGKLLTYTPSPVTLTIGQNKASYETKAAYVFASKDGSAIFLLKTIKESYNQGNHWAVEKIITGN